MYMPENKVWKSGEEFSIKRKPARKRHTIGIAGALLLLLLLLLAALLMNQSEQAEKPAQDKLSHDLAKLWSWNDAVSAGGAQSADWHLRWNLNAEDHDAFERLVSLLYRDADGQPISKTVTKDGNSAQGDAPVYGGVLSVHVVERTEEGVSIVVLLDRKGMSGLSLNELLASAEGISSQITSITRGYTASMKSHGFTNRPDAAVEIERLAQGKVLEQYEEDGTQSVTLSSGSLLLEQQLEQGKLANVQVSIHEHTERDELELTIGVPLITGEFGSVFEN